MKGKGLLKHLIRDLDFQSVSGFLALFLTIVQVGLMVYQPILLGQIIDLLLEADYASGLVLSLIKLGILIGLSFVLQWWTPRIYSRMLADFSFTMRRKLIEKLHRLPLSYLDRQSPGDLVSRVITDLEQLHNGLSLVFSQFLTGLVTLLLTLFFMFELDGGLLLLVVILTPLSLFVARFMAKKSYHYSSQQTQSRGQQSQLVEEVARQTSLLQVFNAQEQARDQFDMTNQAYMDYSLKAIFYSSIVPPATRLINALIYALLAGLGALRIMRGSLTVGQLMTFLNFAQQYTKPFNDISSVLAELQSSLACGERLYAILDEPERQETGNLFLESQEVKGEFEFKDISFGYDKSKPLIQNLNLRIPAGSRVAIVGPTGAGKSTLINLLMRFYGVDAGHIELDGIPIRDFDLASYRQQIGMVLQESWLKTATIHDNIAYSRPGASRQAVEAAARAANADFFIQQLPAAYDSLIGERGITLSQGQSQLLTIARIFLSQPNVLILDEATSSIDTRTELLVQEALEKLMQGRTSFIIAHRLSTIRSADMILVMQDGAIVQQGTHEQLLAQPGLYAQLQNTYRENN